MPTPIYCTLDGDPGTSVQPYIPTVDDMGGAAFVDDDIDPPEPEENVMARDINQMQELLVRACRMMPKASFEVRYNNVTPTLTLLGFKSCNGLFLSSQVTLTQISNGFTAKWPIELLPVAIVGPMISVSYLSVLDGASNEIEGHAIVSQSVDATYAYVSVELVSSEASTGDLAVTCRVDIDGEGTFAT